MLARLGGRSNENTGVGEQTPQGGDRDGVVDAGAGNAFLNDADDLAFIVQHRAAGVTGIEGGIELNDFQIAFDLAQGGDVTETDEIPG